MTRTSPGTAGLAGYLYLRGSEGAQAAAKPKVSDKSALDPQNFLDFKLKKVEPYNHNTAKCVSFFFLPSVVRRSSPSRAPLRFIFELPPDTASLLPVASCVIVKSSADSPTPLVDAKGKPVIRPYTPISPSDLPGELTFLVKKYDEGKMSKYIHEMKLGDKLSIKGPIPKFEYKSASLFHLPSRSPFPVLCSFGGVRPSVCQCRTCRNADAAFSVMLNRNLHARSALPAHCGLETRAGSRDTWRTSRALRNDAEWATCSLALLGGYCSGQLDADTHRSDVCERISAHPPRRLYAPYTSGVRMM